MGTIALLTDFGLKDGFVGVMKGVILSINSNVNLVDITHEISPFDILEGSLVLRAFYKYFPKGTIFLVVVDPGVGTERKGIVVKTENYIFVAPDNGVLTLPLQYEKVKEIRVIQNPDFILKRDNETFHGRDIFAPVSAHLSNNLPLELIGNKLKDYQRFDFPKPKIENGYIIGEILKFDRFGNGITNIEELPEFEYIKVGDYKIYKTVETFLKGDKNKLNITKGSFGFYEIFTPLDSAKDRFRLKLKEKIIIKVRSAE